MEGTDAAVIASVEPPLAPSTRGQEYE